MCFFLAIQLSAALKITVPEGSLPVVRPGAVGELVVQLLDDQDRGVAGAVVTFQLPNSGASGSFPDGGTFLTVISNQRGRATALVKTNNVAGEILVRVSASSQDQSASITIPLKSEAAVGGPPPAVRKGGSGKVIAILAVVGGGAAGAVLATAGKGGSKAVPSTPVVPTPAATPATVLTPGVTTFGAPR